MNDHDELQEFDLDDILREFHQNPPEEDVPEQPAEEDGKGEAPSEPPAQEPAGDREVSAFATTPVVTPSSTTKPVTMSFA